MLPTFNTVSLPATGANVSGFPWDFPSRITAEDGSNAFLFAGGSATGAIRGSSFDFSAVPSNAFITGLSVSIIGASGDANSVVTVNLPSTTTKSFGTSQTNPVLGGDGDLWGATSIAVADLASINVTIETTVNGASGSISIDAVFITVFWQIPMDTEPSDVPLRVDYKVYTKDGFFLGNVPNVTSDLAFTQDKNSAGSTLTIKSAQDLSDVTTTENLLTEDSLDILTEDDLELLAEETYFYLQTGDSDNQAIFKNANRIKAWLYDYWHPNGKLMFSGQINNISFNETADGTEAEILVLSDGFDMANFIARTGLYAYTNDVSQTTNNASVTISTTGAVSKPTQVWTGQTFTTGAAVDNTGQITLRMQGYADITVDFYTSPGGSLIGSATKSISNAGFVDESIQLPQPITQSPSTQYYFTVKTGHNQSAQVRYNTTNVYSGGNRYASDVSTSGDLYFITAYGTPNTTAAFTSDDPVTEMMSAILADYNNRGGYITEGDFEATGLSLSYTFIVSFVYDALTKILELSPNGYYAYVDLGLATMDIKQTNSEPDYLMVKGLNIDSYGLSLDIQQVKNYKLFTGGDTGGGVNLFRDYIDNNSVGNYGLRTDAQTDNRVTLTPTADAIGESFIAENSQEVHNTTVTVLNKYIDITTLTPGKTIGFRNFNNVIDSLVLQIVRREYTPEAVKLTVGKLPPTLSAEIQSIQRSLLNEQTLDNPANPS